MKALVIGAGGFVGGYLINELISREYEVCATKLPGESIKIYGEAAGDFRTEDLDILDENAIVSLLRDTAPDCIFHLAAQSSVALSWKMPALTADINIKGCIDLLEAVRKTVPSARVILIGSGEEYGHAANREEAVDETVLPAPGNIYAVTKYAQNMIGGLYCRSYDMDIISVRAFNHIGPGQLPRFVISDFCKQAADIELGRNEPVIKVGNLAAKRDFTDVRDVVRAYAEIAAKGIKGETYNVGSGKAISISSILDKICSLSSADISIETDSSRFRPNDVPKIEPDITKLKTDTGWAPSIRLEKSLSDILDYWRGQ